MSKKQGISFIEPCHLETFNYKFREALLIFYIVLRERFKRNPMKCLQLSFTDHMLTFLFIRSDILINDDNVSLFEENEEGCSQYDGALVSRRLHY